MFTPSELVFWVRDNDFRRVYTNLTTNMNINQLKTETKTTNDLVQLSKIYWHDLHTYFYTNKKANKERFVQMIKDSRN